MQAQTPEVSAEKANTPAEHRLVSVEQLKKIHRDLDACQKVIWLAGCRPRGYGFDPSYVTDAQERLKEIEALLEDQAPAQDERKCERLRKDAERYRWLRDKTSMPGVVSSNSQAEKYFNEYMLCGEPMDKAIDAAMAAKR